MHSEFTPLLSEVQGNYNKLTMKIAHQAKGHNGPRYSPPPIPLEREEVNVTLKKGEYADFKLLTDPDDEDSLEYTLSLPYFKKGRPEDWLIFCQTLKKVFRGLNIQNGVNVVPIVSDELFGESLRIFANKIRDFDEPTTMAEIEEALDAVTTAIFPYWALACQCHYMRRQMRKPASMTIWSYINHVQEINKLLNDFLPFKDD